jgi:hypothetical protein
MNLRSFIPFRKKQKQFPTILLTGMPKTGTTILYHSIRKAMPGNTICFFEPEHKNKLVPAGLHQPALVKSFIPYSLNFDHFQKKILITRDPRDHLISTLLYAPFNIVSLVRFGSEEKSEEYLVTLLGLLRKKEADPSSVTVREIQALYSRWPAEGYGAALIEYSNQRPEMFLSRYEDIIDNKLDALEKFIGFKFNKADDVPEKWVVRSKAYGNWKDWFTPEDIEYYRPHYKPFMDRFGYVDDWKLNDPQHIDPKISSEYVVNLVTQARELKARQDAKKAGAQT